MKDNIQKYLTQYQILNNKLNEQVKEFYNITNILLIINGSIIALFNISRTNILSIYVLMVATCTIWLEINKSYKKWKEGWIEEIKICEKKLYYHEHRVWQKITNKAKLKQYGSISGLINCIVWLLLIYWLYVIILYLLNNLNITIIIK